MNDMKILYISQYFPPEAGATQARAFEMTRFLAERGHDVTVLCNMPNHPSGIIAAGYQGHCYLQERDHGLRIIRTWVFTRPRKSIFVRAAFYLSFMISSFWAGLKSASHYDVVLATSPPPMTGLTGWLLSKLKGASFVYEVRDLWREMALQLGALRNPVWLWLGRRLDHFLYHHADRLISVTQGIHDELIRLGWGHKSHLIRNGTNPDLFMDRGRGFREKLGWDGKFIVLYAGVLGLAQGMEDLCALAERLKPEATIQLAVAGAGPLTSTMQQLKEEKQLHNLMLLGEISREEIAAVISAADCGLVPLKNKPLFRGAVPTKMFDFMACERPVVVSVDGEAREIVAASQAGVYVEPEDIDGMAEAIRFLSRNPAACREMGRVGRRYVQDHFLRRRAAMLLEEVLKGTGSKKQRSWTGR